MPGFAGVKQKRGPGVLASADGDGRRQSAAIELDVLFFALPDLTRPIDEQRPVQVVDLVLKNRAPASRRP